MITNHTIFVHRWRDHLHYKLVFHINNAKQDRHQEILETAGDKGQWIKRVTKVNESKDWMEVFRRNLLSMEFQCVLLNSLNRRHPLVQALVRDTQLQSVQYACRFIYCILPCNKWFFNIKIERSDWCNLL